MSTIEAPTREVTLNELAKMPDEDRYELVDGRLVERTVSAVSSRVAMILGRLLGDHCDPTGAALVFGPDLGYACFPGRPNKLRRPDLTCVRPGRMSTEQYYFGYVKFAPDLAVEVVSPNDLAYEVDEKVDEYLAVGVRLVWVINPMRRSVLVYRDGGIALLREADELDGEDVVPGFRCRVADLFASIPHPPEGLTG